MEQEDLPAEADLGEWDATLTVPLPAKTAKENKMTVSVTTVLEEDREESVEKMSILVYISLLSEPL